MGVWETELGFSSYTFREVCVVSDHFGKVFWENLKVARHTGA
jgi:hypothetical protein